MSALTEKVPAVELRKDDFVTLPHDGGEAFATIRRVIAPEASGRILVDYYILGGGIGTVSLCPDDLVLRVRERQAS